MAGVAGPTLQIMKNKVVIFENLTSSHLLLVLWYWLWGYDLRYLLTVSQRASGSWWFRRLQTSGRLGEVGSVDLVRWSMYEGYEPAFEAIDPIYEDQFKNNALIRRTERIYESDTVNLAFKKALLLDLHKFVYYRLLCTRIIQELPPGTPATLVPNDPQYALLPRQYAKHLRTTQLLSDGMGDAVTISFWGKIVAYKRNHQQRIRAGLVGLRSVFKAWRQFARPGGKPSEKQNFRFAIGMISALREFSNPVRGVDFLFDGNRIHSDNTLFIPLVHLTDDLNQQLIDKGLNLSEGPAAPSFDDARRLSFQQVRMILGIPFHPSWLGRTATHLVNDFWFWTGFCERYNVANLVSSVDFGFNHIGRNIILNRNGTHTWYYLDSLNTGEASLASRNGEPYKMPFWSFLHYDSCVTWNDRHAAYFGAHKQQISEYISVGCLWSEHVRLVRSGKIKSQFKEMLSKAGYMPHHKLVAVFDHSYGAISITNYKDGAAFLLDLEQLVNDDPEIFLVLKEKKPRRFLKHDFWFSMNPDGDAVEKILERLESHPRIYLPGYDVSPSELIALADLTISLPFTSTTLEALGVGSKSIFYDPSAKFLDAFNSQIPGLVAHGYAQLQTQVETLLYNTSEEYYQEYLENQIRPILDPYLDGMALTRFRDLLCGEPIDPPRPPSKSAQVDPASTVTAD